MSAPPPLYNSSTPRRLVSWNVNGLRAALKKGLLDWVQADQPDILCLQETKLQGHQLTFDMTHPPGGYYTYYSHATRPGYSGVAIWSKEKPLRVQEGFGVEAFDSEGRTLIAEYEHFLLYATYYPNGTSGDTRLQYKMEFYQAFLEGHLKPLLATGKPIVLTGDFNTAHHAIDLARPKDNEGTSGFLPMERAWMDDLVNAGFVDTFRQLHPNEPDRYSWWAMRSRARERNVGWRIDYFFVTQNLLPRMVEADILHTVEGSDHAPVLLELSC